MREINYGRNDNIDTMIDKIVLYEEEMKCVLGIKFVKSS